jgi:hypothetical protein
VAILSPQFGEKHVASLLAILFCSEYRYTLCEKTGFLTSKGKDPFFKQVFRDVNPEFWYGHLGQEYLCARKVKNLRCEENKKDCLKSTLYWTELPKFIPNPDFDQNGPLPDNPADLIKQARGERDVKYKYSIRVSIEQEKKRREKRNR